MGNRFTSKFGITAMALAAAAVTLGSGVNASAAVLTSLTIGATAPTPTASDVYNLVGSTNDSGNVNTSSGGGYGGSLYGASGTYGNDQYQYVSNGRPAQGQTFTTGANSTGYMLTNLWVQHPGYTNPTIQNGYNGTYWQLGSGANLTVRITQISGSSLTTLQTETYTATGNEASPASWGTGSHSTTGDGYWLDFALGTPITLAANTQYGFDIGTSSSNAYFEILGTDGSAAGYNFTGGNAYLSGPAVSGGTSTGVGNNTAATLSGSRVFLASMTANPVPEPATLGLLAIGAIGLLLLKRKTA